MERINLFEAQEEDMQVFNGQALLNKAIEYTYDDDDETLYDFPGYQSSFMYIYNERDGQLLKSYTTQITRNSNVQVLNCSVADMTFEETGKFFYITGFVSHTYEIALRFGNFYVK